MTNDPAVAAGVSETGTGLDVGMALCLSGGGFRAMLFHVGAVRRISELGVLEETQAISSVSGGSITSAVMAMHWHDDGLDLDAFERSIFDFAGRTIDVRAVFGAWVRFQSVSSNLARLYDRHLFGGRSLQDVPDEPQFIFNTTNMHSGNSFQWTKELAHDYALGDIIEPDVPLSTIVAASSAFPPVLSPSRLDPPGDLVDATTGRPVELPHSQLWLTDGGVYDNLGLQPVDHLATLLVSDGGAPFVADARLRRNWLSLTLRTMTLLQDQVAKRRRYEELYAPDASSKTRLFWSLRGDSTHDTTDGLRVTPEQLRRLAATHTRLAKMPTELSHRLANLGYALADHRVRPALRPDAEPPKAFPYPGGLG